MSQLLAVPKALPLKWAGGKRWLVPRLLPLWRAHKDRRLVEPFCGSLAVSLGLLPERALLHDGNPHLINFYRWLQRGLVITLPLSNDAATYYRYRRRFNQLIQEGQGDSSEAAELFYYLNRTGYNGLCRFNRAGEFNVPFGRHRTINYVGDFHAYRDVFRRWTFCTGSFEELRLRPDDFVYADPPYDVEFTRYSKDAFTWDDQVRLVHWLLQHPGPVVLSNQATPRILKLYTEAGFEVEIIPGPRRISCTGDRTPAPEVLARRGC